ncbi:hypothetical protein [Nocardia sp. NPDC056100]|uniref:hypothetical protein n=1 Tax=Nocardia sp. NPDC056100 TaxID=3345712 RepID=UPI0035DF72A4
MTVGIGITRSQDAFFVRGELARWFVIVYAVYDVERGWVDVEGPEVNAGLFWTLESILANSLDAWQLHTVNLHWELDAATRAEAERLNLTLPSHVHMLPEPDPPPWRDPANWIIPFDDPPF